MPRKKFDYTGSAISFTGRFPFISFISIQITFWVFAEILIGVIFYLLLSAIAQTFPIPYHGSIFPHIGVGFVIGFLYGLLLGFADYILESKYFRRKSLGIILLVKYLIAVGILLMLFGMIRFMLYDLFIKPLFIIAGTPLTDTFWLYIFYIFLIYNLAMILVISFINQVNKKYGPGVLLPLLLGKYRKPRVEEKIFMFMDLRSSTMIAEKIGHLKYSSFISDSFMDINLLLGKYKAEVYQYVGDEMIITWRLSNGLKDNNCLRFFFACGKEFEERSDHYISNYGIIPEFKAGLHIGSVTTVEVGEIKRDLAHHGDTVNTASRIQSICNTYNKNLLVSRDLCELIQSENDYKTESLGEIKLKGKANPIEIISIEHA